MKMKKPFGIIFDPKMQPGFQGRFGLSARGVLGLGSITGTAPPDDPEPYTADQVMRERVPLEQKFQSMQVPQLLPSKLLRRNGK